MTDNKQIMPRFVEFINTASEKLAVMVTMDYLRREASAGRREDFEKWWSRNCWTRGLISGSSPKG